jgi:hypothetical protein
LIACSTREWVSLPPPQLAVQAPPHQRCGNNRPVSAKARTTPTAGPVRKLAEQILHRLADLLIGVEDHLTVVVGITHGQRRAQLTALRRGDFLLRAADR